MDNFVFQFKIGNFTCSAIKDGEDWDRNVLFIDTGRHQVLIDTGNGDATSPRGLLLERLEALGILSAAIDVVILSHGDIDHIAGTMDAEGKLMFPNARHVLARDESTFWLSNVKRTSPSHNVLLGEDWTQLVENFPRGRLAQISHNLDLIKPET